MRPAGICHGGRHADGIGWDRRVAELLGRFDPKEAAAQQTSTLPTSPPGTMVSSTRAATSLLDAGASSMERLLRSEMHQQQKTSLHPCQPNKESPGRTLSSNLVKNDP